MIASRYAVATLCILVATAAPVRGQVSNDPDAWPLWYAGGDSLSAGVHAIEKDSVYTVRGSTAEQLQEEMDARAPVVDGRRVQGAHFWEWWHHYEYTPVDSGRCRVTRSVVLVRSLIVLPQWVDNGPADRELMRAWNGYRFRLREHEDGHRTITLGAATDLWNRIQTRPPSSCSNFREDVRALADSVFRSSATSQAAYDVETSHGLRQGARWPPG